MELSRHSKQLHRCTTADESEEFLKIGALVSPVLALRTQKWEGLCRRMQQCRRWRQGCNSGSEQ
jgi:hypothetical protein